MDSAISIGTDFNRGIKGVGLKKGLALIKDYRSLESMPEDIRPKLPGELEEKDRSFVNQRLPTNTAFGTDR